MGHHNKKVYDSLPFKNQAIDTITITGFNTNKQHKVVVPKKKIKKDLNKKELSEVLKNFPGTFPKKK
jgi:hypothetical protein